MTAFARWMTLGVCALALVAGNARAQDDEPRDASAALARQRAYLQRSPYNKPVFEQLLASAAEDTGLEALLEVVRAERGADEATRILLARLEARAGNVDAARAALGRVTPGAQRALLLADIELRVGRFDAALDALARVGRDADVEARRAAAELRGQAQYGRGAWRLAAEAFLSIRELGSGVDHALDAAELLARYGLLDDARIAYDDALARATDVEQRVAILVGFAALHERRIDGPAAIEQLRAADALLGRGHWRKTDVRARLVDLHRRAGQLAEWEAACRAASEAQPRDVALREAWAGALAALGRDREALNVLGPALLALPHDRPLADQQLSLLRATEDLGGELAELQRVLLEHPGDLELEFRLGEVLLALGRRDAAATRWGDALAARPEDVRLAARVARAWAAGGDEQRSIDSWGVVLARAPQDVAFARAFALQLKEAGRSDEALAVARAVVERVRGVPPLLAAGAEVLVDLGALAEGIAALEDQARLDPSDDRAQLRLAELLLRAGRGDDARRRLRALIGGADPALRRNALDRYVRSLQGRELRRMQLEREALALDDELARGAVDPARALIVARLHVSLSERELAQRALEAYLDVRPDDSAIRDELARRWMQLGDLREALRVYDELERRDPERVRGYRRARAKVLARMGRRREALELLVEHMDESRSTPRAALDLARSFDDLGSPSHVLQVLETALRVHPEHAPLRLALARSIAAEGDPERAAAELVRVYREGDAGVRRDAVAELVRTFQLSARVHVDVLQSLRASTEANPYDLPARRLRIALQLRFGEDERAARDLDELLATIPEDAEALGLRAELRLQSEQWELAARDLERLRLLGAEDDQALVLDLLDCYLAGGRLDDAFDLSDSIEPLAAAKRFAARDQAQAAVRLLEALVESPRASGAAWRELGDLRFGLGEFELAVEAYNEVERAGEADAQLYLSLAKAHGELGREEEVIDAARTMLRYPDAERLAETYFRTRRSLRGAYYQLLADESARLPLDEAHVSEGIIKLLGDKRDEAAFGAIDVVRQVRAQTLDVGRWPEGHDAASWDARLREWSLRAHLHRSKTARVRIKALRDVLDGPDATREDWYEWAVLMQRRLRLWESDSERIERALELYPDSPELHLALLQACTSEGRGADHALGVRLYTGLVAWAGEPAQRAAEQGARERDFAAHVAEVRRDLRRLRPVVIDERIESVALRTWVPGPLAPPGSVLPSAGLRDLRMGLARSLALVGDRPRAEALYDELLPFEDAPLGERIDYANGLLAAGFEERWFDAALALMRLRTTLLADRHCGPVMTRMRPLADFVADAARTMSRLGHIVPAYDALREGNEVSLSYSIVGNDAASHAELIGHYERRIADLEARAGLEEVERLELRNLHVKLGELFAQVSRVGNAATQYARGAELLPADYALLAAAADYADEAGRVERALALTRSAIAAKELVAERGEQRPLGRLVVPSKHMLPYFVQLANTNAAFQLRTEMRALCQHLPGTNPLRERLLLVQFLLELERDDEAAIVLADLARIHASESALPSPMVEKLYTEVRGALPSAHDTALLAGLRDLAPGHMEIARLHASALIDAGRLEEAEAALIAFRGASFAEPQMAERVLARLERQLARAEAADKGDDER